MNKRVTNCVLLYGNYPGLARQAIDSLVKRCDQDACQLIVGCNARCQENIESPNSVSQFDHLMTPVRWL